MGEFVLIPKEKVEQLKMEGYVLFKKLELENSSSMKLKMYLKSIFEVLDEEF